MLCADCVLNEGLIRVRDGLAVEVKPDRLVVKRGNDEVEALPGEVRHLVNALVEGAERLGGEPDKARCCSVALGLVGLPVCGWPTDTPIQVRSSDRMGTPRVPQKGNKWVRPPGSS